MLNLGLWGALLGRLRHAPREQRRASPDWHHLWAGIGVAALAAALLDWHSLAALLFWPAAKMAIAVWGTSLHPAMRMPAPPPLRPLLALHLMPPAILGWAAFALGWTQLGTALAWLALAGLAVGAGCARWLLAYGFSALWGLLGLPLAATAAAWVALWQAAPFELHRLVAGILLAAATLAAMPILVAVLRDWARGRLPARTNAAIA